MTFDEFVKKYNGETVDYDGSFPGQCVDLYRLYLRDVIDTPQTPAVSGARLIWNTAPQDHFEKIPNTLFAIPKKGDVIIWGAFHGNPYGHVGMCIVGRFLSFTSFDSNWSRQKKAGIEQHDYKNVIGWLRPKTAIDIQKEFRDIWLRPGAKGELSYFERRLAIGSIRDVEDLRVKMRYWNGVVYPNGVYSVLGDIRWQREKRK